MSHPQFSTSDCAAHLVHYFDAQPVIPRALSLDEQIDALKANLLTAKATDNQAEIARLRITWLELREEIEVEAIASADLAADACLPFEPTVAELREAGALDTSISIDLDCCVAAIDQARAEHPSKRLESAWTWLSERSAITFTVDGALVVDSATWSNARYHVRADGTCNCPARKPCWHLEARALVDAALENAKIDALADLWA